MRSGEEEEMQKQKTKGVFSKTQEYKEKYNERNSTCGELYYVLELGPARPKKSNIDPYPVPSPIRNTDWIDESIDHPTYTREAISLGMSDIQIQDQLIPR
ncbi:hypothetical protein PIB30_069172 [Stylosanthes scabra]|uniref:Uncharacterized protein n=1 Tax=Stylosanthes scabra TaxID=79078 RepID=A0ABU6SN71_9FABA|nr:hypothetical protein [Stylosanthes scabra]